VQASKIGVEASIHPTPVGKIKHLVKEGNKKRAVYEKPAYIKHELTEYSVRIEATVSFQLTGNGGKGGCLCRTV
jgi:hypothetical protein